MTTRHALCLSLTISKNSKENTCSKTAR